MAAARHNVSRRAGLGARLPVDYVCRTCGGTAVSRDAWAGWDAGRQQWELGATFDDAFCHDCESETELLEVDLITREPTGG